jgi:diacylglycerol O-acyltransferase
VSTAVTQRLSFVDQIMHRVGTTGLASLDMQGAIVVDPARGVSRHVTARRLASHMASRLERIPMLRKKLVQDPLHLGDLRLVDDPAFDVWNHIEFATLPKPGSQLELLRELGRISVRHLQGDRPLWRFVIVDGLADGRLVVAQRFSHATMDGLTAIKVMASLHDAKPTRPSPYRRSRLDTVPPLPSTSWLLVTAGIESTERLLLKAPRFALTAAGVLLRRRCSNLRSVDIASPAPAPVTPRSRAPRTSLNAAISSDRRNLAFSTFALDELKRIAVAHDCSINDLGLLLLSEALLNYFRGIDEEVAGDLFAAMPINARQADSPAVGNALGARLVNLHTTVPALPARLRAIGSDTTAAKQASGRHAHGGTGKLLTGLGDVLPPVVIDAAAWLLHALQPWDRLPIAANAILSNVSGPRETIYLAGMPVELQIPMVPMFPTCALASCVVSMGNQLTLGFHACGRVVDEAHMRHLTAGAERALRTLSSGVRRSRGT